MKKDVEDKILETQKYITSPTDISKYGYIKTGYNRKGVQRWKLSKSMEVLFK